MTEIWKDIKDWEGIYKISNLGKAKSLGNDLNRREKILKIGKNTNGYYQIHMCRNGKRFCKLIHILVAEMFLNYVPNNTSIVVDHIDDNRSNNNIDNLQIITQRENVSRGKLCKNSSSKYVGVHWVKGSKKWKAQIRMEKGVQIYLGTFINEYDAHIAYKNKLKELLKEIKTLEL